MILDNELVLSSAQALTATTSSTNTIDLGNAVHELGTGEPLYVVFRVVTATLNDSSGTDATCAITLVEDDNDSFSSTATAMTVGTFSHGDTVGTELVIRLGPGNLSERYVKALYTVAAGPFDAGAIDAFLVKDIHSWVAKPNAVGASLPHEA